MTFRFFFLQKRVKLRTDLSELEKIGIKSFNLGILRTRVWTRPLSNEENPACYFTSVEMNNKECLWVLLHRSVQFSNKCAVQSKNLQWISA
jgi:hypothetical protein